MDSTGLRPKVGAGGTGSDRDFALPQGRLRGRVRGPEGGQLALLVPGLTANLIAMERIAEALSAAGWCTVSLDLRGLGYSDTTPPGTYGWERHARDLIDLADQLHARRFAVVGHSMGAHVAEQAAVMAPERISRLALIDLAGAPTAEVNALVSAALPHLFDVHPSADAYVARVRSRGTVVPWEEMWDRHYRYEQVEVEGGVRTRTSEDAVLEDVAYGDEHDATALWPQLRCPVLLVRATLPYSPSMPEAFDVPAESVPGFLACVRCASVVEIKANHYGVLVSPAIAAAVVASFNQGS